MLRYVITKTSLFKYIENFISKNGKFLNKKFWYFSHSKEYSQSMFWAVIRKLMYTPVNPSFLLLYFHYIKGDQNYIYACFRDV